LEDVYYILTFVPHNPKKAGKLKIKVKNRRCKVLYDNNFRYDYINEYLQKLEEKIKTPDIKIENFSFDRKILAFTVTNYLVKETDEKMTKMGRMKVHIRVRDTNNRSLFDQEKMLTAQNDQMKISLAAFKNLEKGEYDFFIDAMDIFTGKEANLYQKIKIR
jgi:5-hydroxyisourate hydrolase-like protein (transthyretin family)